jgi:ribosomal protein L2
MGFTLNDTERKILAATLERSMVSGAELARYAGTSDWKNLADAVKNLQANKLVEVSGNILDVKEFPYATIGVVPSNRHYLYDVLKA